MDEEFPQPEVKFAEGNEGFSRACFEVFSLVQQESQSPQNPDNYVVGVCTDMESLIEEGKRHALVMMRTMSMGCIPTYVLLSTAGRGVMIPMMMPSLPERHEDRLAMISPLSMAINLAPMDAYVFVSEVWTAAYDKNQQDDRAPSERPDRKEMLMVMAFKPGQSEIRIFDIIRGERKEDVDIKPATADQANMEARNPCMSNLFDLGSQLLEIVAAKELATEGKTLH